MVWANRGVGFPGIRAESDEMMELDLFGPKSAQEAIMASALRCMNHIRAYSAAGAHFLHTEGATGSNPVTPTIEFLQVSGEKLTQLACFSFAVSCLACVKCVSGVRQEHSGAACRAF